MHAGRWSPDPLDSAQIRGISDKAGKSFERGCQHRVPYSSEGCVTLESKPSVMAHCEIVSLLWHVLCQQLAVILNHKVQLRLCGVKPGAVTDASQVLVGTRCTQSGVMDRHTHELMHQAPRALLQLTVLPRCCHARPSGRPILAFSAAFVTASSKAAQRLSKLVF